MTNSVRLDQLSLILSDNLERRDMFEYHEPTPHLYGRQATLISRRSPRHSEDEDEEQDGSSYVVCTPSGSVYIPADMGGDTVARHKYGTGRMCQNSYSSAKDVRYATPFSTIPATLPNRAHVKYPPPSSDVCFRQAEIGVRKSNRLLPCSWKSAAIAFLTLNVLLLAILIYFVAAFSTLGRPPESCDRDVTSGGPQTPGSRFGQQQGNPAAEGVRLLDPVGGMPSPLLRVPRSAAVDESHVPVASTPSPTGLQPPSSPPPDRPPIDALRMIRRDPLVQKAYAGRATSPSTSTSSRHNLKTEDRSERLRTKIDLVQEAHRGGDNFDSIESMDFINELEGHHMLESSGDTILIDSNYDESIGEVDLLLMASTDIEQTYQASDSVVGDAEAESIGALQTAAAVNKQSSQLADGTRFSTGGEITSSADHTSPQGTGTSDARTNHLITPSSTDDDRTVVLEEPTPAKIHSTKVDGQAAATSVNIAAKRPSGSTQNTERLENIAVTSHDALVMDHVIDSTNPHLTSVVRDEQPQGDDPRISGGMASLQTVTRTPPASQTLSNSAERPAGRSDTPSGTHSGKGNHVIEFQPLGEDKHLLTASSGGVVDKDSQRSAAGGISTHFESTSVKSNGESASSLDHVSPPYVFKEEGDDQAAPEVRKEHADVRGAVRNVTISVSVEGTAGVATQVYILSLALPIQDHRPITASLQKADSVDLGDSKSSTPSTKSSGSSHEDPLDAPTNIESDDKSLEAEHMLQKQMELARKTLIGVNRPESSAVLHDGLTQLVDHSLANSDILAPEKNALHKCNYTTSDTSATRSSSSSHAGTAKSPLFSSSSPTDPSHNSSSARSAALLSESRFSSDSSTASQNPPQAAPACFISRPHPVQVVVVQDIVHQTVPPAGRTFHEVQLGQSYTETLPSHGYWSVQFYLADSSHIQWNGTVPRGTSLAVYARRNALPTHTQYDFQQLLRGFNQQPDNEYGSLVSQSFAEYLRQGHWFLTLYNDGGHETSVSMVLSLAGDLNEHCPAGCTGHGECLLGRCQCLPGFSGEDCSQMTCPLLCSGNGDYRGGVCECKPEWKGPECSTRHDECEVPDCNGHGRCLEGVCQCGTGYRGQFCQLLDCPHPTCNGHGFCVEGVCVCQRGWRGPACSQTDQQALSCLPECSKHGQFNPDEQQCVCFSEWTGADCSVPLCSLDCGSHGTCESNVCKCEAGWKGDRCQLKTCDPRCMAHGQCKNGTCLCATGWNGKHCTLDGCPKGCDSKGTCQLSSWGEWNCRCQTGWFGSDCSVPLETNCNDGKDNDNDGLGDCEDPECCQSTSCAASQLCLTSPDPADVLLRKHPPPITARFFERSQFLIEEGSVQLYALGNAFNQSRAAVIRGRVTTASGRGIPGARVGTPEDAEGITLSRHDGWFDFMVNGGGVVKLWFRRTPFQPASKAVFVPWNEIVVIDDVVLGVDPYPVLSNIGPSCPHHDYDVTRPVVLASWKHEFQSGCCEGSSIVAESQVVKQSLNVPGTGLRLLYYSSRSRGYQSTIQLQLTPHSVSPALKLVHLRVHLQGQLFSKTFEAEPNIRFTYAWDRLNVYRQRVYGMSTATVRVGYEYSDCPEIIWDVQTTDIASSDIAISNIGGWNLDIHHAYNIPDGIVQKGDGMKLFLRKRPQLLQMAVGNGHQREMDCRLCEGAAAEQLLLAATALAAAPDGSIYIGDFNLIRRLTIDGQVQTVAVLNATGVSYRYHLTYSALDNTLYVSSPESYRIMRVRSLTGAFDLGDNMEAAVGSGERCPPGDRFGCGDGGMAHDARLTYPKGMVMSADGNLFFADGTNIRMVDPYNIITTIVGNNLHKSHWRPFPCSGSLGLDQVQLRWPTELAISPLDDTVHFIDDHLVFKITGDWRVRRVAGKPLQCPSPHVEDRSRLAVQTTLVEPQALAFSSVGDLYVAESDGQRINRVRVVLTDGSIEAFAGAESKCNCLDSDCDCYDESHVLASWAVFSSVSALAISPTGAVYISDQANHRIRRVVPLLPTTDALGHFHVHAPDVGHTYVFNHHGQHLQTQDIVTRRALFRFDYNLNSSNGKLSSVTDAVGNKVSILRDYAYQVTSIENPLGEKTELIISPSSGHLQQFITPDGFSTTFHYSGSSGLLVSRSDSFGRSLAYTYDQYGRVTDHVTSTGHLVQFRFDLNNRGASVTVVRDGVPQETIFIKHRTVVRRKLSGSWESTVTSGGDLEYRTPWGESVTTDAAAYPPLTVLSRELGATYPVLSAQQTALNEDPINRFQWQHFATTSGKARHKRLAKVGRRLLVNGDVLLTLEYNMEDSVETVRSGDNVTLLDIVNDDVGRPIAWRMHGAFKDSELEYDGLGRLKSWKRGRRVRLHSYDSAGRLIRISRPNLFHVEFGFSEDTNNQPSWVRLPSGSRYHLHRDKTGSVTSVTVPGGGEHGWLLQAGFGHTSLQYNFPGASQPYMITYSDRLQVLERRLPDGRRVVHDYDPAGRVENTVWGTGDIRFRYQPDGGLLKSLTQRDQLQEATVEFRYHSALLKRQETKYKRSDFINNVKLKYQYDGSARLRKMTVDIGGLELVPIVFRHSPTLGSLEQVADLKTFNTHPNRSVVHNGDRTFSRVILYNGYNQPELTVLNLHGYDVFKLETLYDDAGRLKTQTASVAGGSENRARANYSQDGQLASWEESGHVWRFGYDRGGNLARIIEDDSPQECEHDSADRLRMRDGVADVDYDENGFVVRAGGRRFGYNSWSRLTGVRLRSDEMVRLAYDWMGRLSWRRDDSETVQLVYADPQYPQRLTHVHFPDTGRTDVYLYGPEGRLVAVRLGEQQRLYVATDALGTPLALFSARRTLVKRLQRDPWGRVLRDTDTSLQLYIGLYGWVYDPRLELIFSPQSRVYDPEMRQYLTPGWQQALEGLQEPRNLHLYRFMYNDPINPPQASGRHLSSLSTSLQTQPDVHYWLSELGYDLDKMQGWTHLNAGSPTWTSTAAGSVSGPLADLLAVPGVVSGLGCLEGLRRRRFGRASSSTSSSVVELLGQGGSGGWRQLVDRLAFQSPPLGAGLLLYGDDDGRAVVRRVDSAGTSSSVQLDVLQAVLNGSRLVKVSVSDERGRPVLHVLRPTAQLSADVQQLRRLGQYEPPAGGSSLQRLQLPGASLQLMYGDSTSREAATAVRQTLLVAARSRAAARRWQQEQRRVSPSGGAHEPSGSWTADQTRQLLDTGRVDRVTPTDRHALSEFPALAEDWSNQQLLPD